VRFWRDERGATAIEYGLVVGLIFLAVISGYTALGGANGGLYKTFNKIVMVLL
jgi:pilus assembly protein Flp/PilA